MRILAFRDDWVVLVAVLMCFPASLVAAQAADERSKVGTVEQVRNRAEALYQGDIRPLAPSAPVLYRDLMRTGPAARLKARLADGSELQMGENAELEVDDFVQSAGEQRSITLDLLKGALRLISGKLQEGAQSSIHVRTPVAILGVRGTDFWVGPIDGAIGVLVITGEVVVASDVGQVSLGPGEGTMIGEDGRLSQAKVWGPAKVDRALAMVALE
jgi:hypothetical protein